MPGLQGCRDGLGLELPPAGFGCLDPILAHSFGFRVQGFRGSGLRVQGLGSGFRV